MSGRLSVIVFMVWIKKADLEILKLSSKFRLKKYQFDKEEEIIHRWSMLILEGFAALLGVVFFYKVF